MSIILRVRTVWTGTPVVGGGISTFYFTQSATGMVADLHTFWAAIGNRVPLGVTWTTANTGDLIDDATGALTGTWTDGTSSSVSSSGTGTYAGGVGARILWQTSGIRNGRRVRGA